MRKTIIALRALAAVIFGFVLFRGDFRLKGTTLVKYTWKGGDVTIPESVTNIGKDVFSYCPSLKEIHLEKGSRLDRSVFPKDVPIVEY